MKTDQQKTDEKEAPRLPTSVVILGLTALGYAVAYIFQFSYLKFFGINYKFIEISPPILVVAILMTIIGYAVVTAWLKPALMLSWALNRGAVSAWLSHYLRMGSYIATTIALILMGFGIDLVSSLLCGVGTVVVLLLALNIEAIFWIIKRKSFRRGFLAFREDVSKMYSRQSAAGADSYFDRYIEYVFVAVFVLALGLACGRQFAVIDALHLPVISSSPTTTRVLIQQSGDKLIAKDYDIQTHQLVGGYILIKIDESNPLVIQRKIDVSPRR
jgi:hypothetical protein